MYIFKFLIVTPCLFSSPGFTRSMHFSFGLNPYPNCPPPPPYTLFCPFLFPPRDNITSTHLYPLVPQYLLHCHTVYALLHFSNYIHEAYVTNLSRALHLHSSHPYSNFFTCWPHFTIIQQGRHYYALPGRIFRRINAVILKVRLGVLD
jgi:hypothetical protein